MKDVPKPATKKPGFRLRVNKRLYVIIVCFIIASIFWLLIALSNNYSSSLTFPVVYTNIPDEKVIMNELPKEITVQVRATGFKVLSYDFLREREPVEINVSNKLMSTNLNNDWMAIPTRSFIADFSRELGQEVNITSFQPDSILFSFSDRITRSIPVELKLFVTFEKQYDTSGSPRIIPSEVEVSGPPGILNSIKSIPTEEVHLKALKAPVDKKVQLAKNKLLSYSTDEIHLKLPVEKFTEASTEAPVHSVNVPQGYSLRTFPDVVKIRYLVALSQYKKVTPSMFDVVVDGNGIDQTKPAYLNVQLSSSPSFVRSVTMEPSRVDYILRKQ